MGYEAFAGYYDFLTENIDYRELAQYYDGLNSKFGGGKGIMLDLACGTGSLSVILRELGYDVIGTDISEEMLSIAVSKEHEGIEYLCQDMRCLDLYGTIDGAICSLDSINHLETAEDVQQVFNRVSLFSNPGALFMFDVNTLYKHEQVLGDNTFVYDDERVYCVWQNEYLGEGKTGIYLDFFEGRKGVYHRYSDDFTETAYPKEQIEEMLTKAGFEVLACYEYPTLLPPKEDSEKLTFVAKKK